ncbi:MlaD family protein [Falsiroseomonas sp. CW058]|uniref:MlaD family protein n=1 Tax=Falsiroseomonas sp. CW058 TaxID=3388664 RepID=UPI003D32024B
MAGRTLYLRVGILVIAGALLAVGFVIFLAGGRGGPTVLVETYTSESVQGLDVGAAVRYRGVPVGRVTEIGLTGAEYPRAQAASRRPEEAADFQMVLVRFAIEQRMLQSSPPLPQMIASGLRARITAQGITGVNYVELDFVSPQRFPPPPVPWTPRNPVVPAVPSTVAQVRGAAEQLMERLASVPLEQIINDGAAVLANVAHQTSDGDLARTLRESAATMAALRRAVEEGDLAGTLAEFRATADALRAAVAGPELRNALASASAAATELRRTAQRLPGAVDGFERTMRAARETTVDVQAELLPILIDLRATTASLRATAEQLRASPSQALFGAPPTPDRRR